MIEGAISLLDASEDPRLLGAVQPRPVQKVILAAIGSGKARIFAIRCGRRSGKTFLTALVMAYMALMRDDLAAMTRPGERRWAVVIGRKESQARVVKDMIEQIVAASPTFRDSIERTTDTEVHFKNGASILVAASADSARGLPIFCLGMTEVAHWEGERGDPDEAGERSAANAARALFPATSQYGRDAIVIIESTPRGRQGYFYELCTSIEAGEIPDAEAFHYSTAESAPDIDPAFLAAEQARDPAAYDVEYGANWSDGGASAFLDFDRFTPTRDADIPPENLVGPVVVGLDMAQSGVIGVAVVGRDPDDPKRLLVAHVDGLRLGRARSLLKHAETQTRLLDAVCAIAKRYHAEVAIDQYCSEAVRGTLTERGIRSKLISQSAPSKDRAHREMRDRIYAGTLDIPADGPLLADLRRLRTKISSTGASSVINPRVKGGGHGDRCSALVLALERQVQIGSVSAPAGKPRGGASIVGNLGTRTTRTQADVLDEDRERRRLEKRAGITRKRGQVQTRREGFARSF
jgi:hypothetical protein